MLVIRIVLTVALATALLAVSLPAVDSARGDRTAASLDADLATVRDAAVGLVDEDDPTRDDVAGARRLVTVDVPHPSWTAATVERVTVRGQTDSSVSTLGYRLDSGRRGRLRLDVPLRTPNGPLVFTTPGAHRLALSLAWGDGDGSGGAGPTVVVRREN
ncbi:hypothetical protein SAMN04487950_2015 [Halogranum rubrum]|uniref:DUF7311 domain-containing protein n=1 Tax=Halogranum rubrum TaxID=553466 RepID=A0A1I4EBY4_9EURY|nr:hypothetical protein SAMN04487950_2015 [Halogranum rubrum]